MTGEHRVCKPLGCCWLAYSPDEQRHKSGGKAEPYGKYGTVKIQDKCRENTKIKYKRNSARA